VLALHVVLDFIPKHLQFVNSVQANLPHITIFIERVVILIEIKFIHYKCFHMIFWVLGLSFRGPGFGVRTLYHTAVAYTGISTKHPGKVVKVSSAGGVREEVSEDVHDSSGSTTCPNRQREFFHANLLVRIHLIIEIISMDRPCTM
jgi:hypothetical protein